MSVAPRRRQTVFVGMGYLFSYLSTATVFELTNPLHYDKTQVVLRPSGVCHKAPS